MFGEAAPNRPGLPLDALILAFHAARTELDAPGVDIRHVSTNADEAFQKVSYYEPTHGVLDAVSTTTRNPQV